MFKTGYYYPARCFHKCCIRRKLSARVCAEVATPHDNANALFRKLADVVARRAYGVLNWHAVLNYACCSVKSLVCPLHVGNDFAMVSEGSALK